MSRLLVHVEGQTEETFVNEVLRPYLLSCGYHSVSARIVGNARQRNRRGGIKPWPAVKLDILRHLKEDTSCIVTTMVDYYGLPAADAQAWPGRTEARLMPVERKAPHVESCLSSDIANSLDGMQRRFIPFIVMHEFEALLFSDCMAFSRGIGQPSLAPDLQKIRDEFESPEHINDSPLTAPSKRVEALIPGYEKPLLGTLAALEIGLEAIRGECPHFNQWLQRLARAAV